MKNLLLIAGAVFVLSLASCKKDRDCECTGGILPDQTFTYEDVNKDDAEEACDLQSTLWTGGSCELN